MTDPVPEAAPPRADTTSAWHRQSACPSCGYSLAGHASPDCCPECGEVFAGLPGGLAWFSGERLRITAFASMLLAVALIANLGLAADHTMSREAGLAQGAELGFSFWFANAASLSRIFPYCLAAAAVLLWQTAPRPRTAMVWLALAGALAYPLITVARDLYLSTTMMQLVAQQRQNIGGMFTGSSMGDVFYAALSGLTAALSPISLALLLGLIAQHLAAVGLEPQARRFGAWVRPALYALPATLIAEYFLTFYGLGGGAGVLANPAAANAALFRGSGLEAWILILGLISTVGTVALALALAVASLRLSLRARWTLEARR